MIKKIQGYFNVVLLLFAAFGVGYFIFNLIKDKITVPDKLTSEIVAKNLTSDNLVKSNQIFDNLDKCLANFIEACVNEKYDELYEIMISNYKKIYSKSDSRKTFEKYKNVFMENEEYTGCLAEAYSYKDDGYLLKINAKDNTILYLYVTYDDYLGTYNYVLIDM